MTNDRVYYTLGPGLVLFAKYTTAYWRVITDIGKSAADADKLVCPSVSKHYDFLETLISGGKLRARNNSI